MVFAAARRFLDDWWVIERLTGNRGAPRLNSKALLEAGSGINLEDR